MTVAGIPKYEQVKQRIISQIRSRQWPAGSPFPSEAQLLTQYKVSRPTLVRSLQELVREGYIYRRKGQGTFVADRSNSSKRVESLQVFVSQTIANFVGDDRLVLEGLLRGIDRITRKHHSNMTLCPVPDGAVDDATRRQIQENPPRVALVIEPSTCPLFCELLKNLGCEICSVNEACDGCYSVTIDQELAGYLATKYLLDRGRRRIALLNGLTATFWGFVARRKGYLRALNEAGIKVDPRRMRELAAPIDTEAGRAMMRSIIKDGIAIDGVVGVTDRKAIGAAAAAREAGLTVPGDLLVIGIDDIVAAHMDPPMSAIAMPFDEVGARSAELAMELFDKPQATTTSPVKTKLVLQPWCVQRN